MSPRGVSGICSLTCSTYSRFVEHDTLQTGHSRGSFILCAYILKMIKISYSDVVVF